MNKKDIELQSDNKDKSLSSFLMDVSDNIGFSPTNSDNKKKTFDPFMIENTSSMKQIYEMMKRYSEKTNQEKLIIPKEISTNTSGKKIRFEFDSELNSETINDIIEEKGYNNIIVDDSLKRLDILKDKN